MTDLRTTAGRRAEIIRFITLHGGFTGDWIYANRIRETTVLDMFRHGEIETDTGVVGMGWNNITLTESALIQS